MLTTPLVSPRGMGQWDPWSKAHLLSSVLTTEAARAATWSQIRKLCKIPIVPSKAGMTGAGDVSLGVEEENPTG